VAAALKASMTEYAYLTRLMTDRAAIQRLDNARSDFEAQIRLLRYAEAEGRTELVAVQAELAAVQAELAAARETAEELKQEAAVARAAVLKRLTELEASLARLTSERNSALADLASAQAEFGRLNNLCRELATEVRKVLRQPWRPLAQRFLYYLFSALTAPGRFSEFFERQAKLRTPRRLQGLVHEADAEKERRVAHEAPEEQADPAYDAATGAIFEKYFGEAVEGLQPSLHSQLGSAEMVARRLAAAPPRAEVVMSVPPARYTVVTPYFAHYAHFGRCAESVAAMLEADAAHGPAPRLQWIVVNDDPSCPDDQLRGMLPAALLPHTIILSSGRNEGIVAAQNRGVRAAANSWVLMLDCDDEIEPNALAVLDSYIGQFPTCRYFSALMTDIDEDGRELRRRRRDAPASGLFGAGMVMGHLVAFRRDLFDELDGFDPRFSGVQDYDFALRAAAREPLQEIPAHLYRYRWHSGTQSVSRAKRQARLTEMARSSVLRGLLRPNAGGPLTAAPLPAEPGGLCIIRTQGARIELLTGAVASVQQQGVPITPCIVVHGDEATRGMVERQLLRELGPTSGPEPIFLAAPDLKRRRGYPCNVGLEFLYAHADRFDLLCFLDDDDHLLPNFGARLVEAMRQRGADLAYGLTNALPVSGEPELQHQLLPSVSLFHGNFMPIHSYLVRTDALLTVKARFDENLDYLEDWDFLIQVVGGGAKAVPLFETVAEYRLIGDGNTQQRKDPEHFEYCLSVVRQRGAEAARRLSPDRFWSDVLDFPTDRRMPLTPGEQASLLAAKALFAGEVA
jgi:hypothetical protein